MSYSYRSSRASSAPRRHSHGGRSSRPNQNRGKKDTIIDPRRFIKAAAAAQVEVYEPKHTFADFALEPLLKANLTAKGYTAPSPIQDQTIPAGLQNKDIIGIANTGTGKTAAFALPVLHRLMTERGSFALIIAPTRELAQQIEEECRELAKGSGLQSAVVIGGAGMGAQIRALHAKPRIVIGTPGRIKDHLQRGTLKLNHFNIVVLDEVDRMLDMGFVRDVTRILQETNPNRQSFFFSATIDSHVRSLIESFTKNPFTVSIKASSASENVHQDIVRYQSSEEKIDKLHDLLIQPDIKKVIVFDATQRSVERLSKKLIARGFLAVSIHGGKTQGQRQRALTQFKQNEVTVLVATDVAARGIDVADVSHVINFTIPKAYDDYIHRIGRAGRAGQIGYALTFVAQG